MNTQPLESDIADLLGIPPEQLHREMDEAAELHYLRTTIEREDDVMRVVKIEAIDGGRFRYLIETPFQTYPKFVIGTTDAAFEDVRILLKFGAEGSALDSWEKGGGK